MSGPGHRPPAGVAGQADINGDLDLSCDVVVIGSGAGGAVMAAELADAGIEVVIVEEGGYHPTSSFTPDTGSSVRALYRDGGASTAIGRPPILFSEGRCVGGSTVINGGMSWRTPPRVLAQWSRAESVVGVTEEEMERHFARVERRIAVAPQDPESIGRDSALLKTAADGMGWKTVANLRNQVHCAGTNNCVHGCPTGAKRSMLVTYLPRALSRGARIFADCRVDRITRHGRQATGVIGRFQRPGGRRGPKLTVRASVVVASAGAVQTPALLARSGFRSTSGQLGRNLTLHPNAKVVALFDEDVYGWQGVHQAYQVREFIDEGILIAAANLSPSLVAMSVPYRGRALGELMQQYNRMVVAGCLVEDSCSGSVRTLPRLGPQVFYRISDRDAARVVRGIALTAELMFAAGARRVITPFQGVPELRGPADAAALLERPIPAGSMDLFTVHLMGTARMSDDARRGVVSSYGEFHGAQRLFVADASLFPSPIGVNPMLTILALAARNAEWLVEHRDRFGI